MTFDGVFVRAARAWVLTAAVLAAACSQPAPATAPATAAPAWVGTWAASPQAPLGGPIAPALTFDDVTLRQIVHTSVGGSALRVRISNTFGDRDLAIGAARVALRADGAGVDAASDRELRFSGRTAIEIPAGATAVSDAVDLDVPAFSNVAVSLYLPEDSGPATSHGTGLQTGYVSESGNHVGTETFPVAREIQSWQFLSGVEVMAPADTTVIVAFGDSITDGAASTPDTNRRWPNYLARRLAARPDASPVAVLDQGISGNRVLHDVIGQNALARFDRDVLAWPGVTHVIVLEGINDIGFPAIQGAPFGDAVDTSAVTADDLIAGYRQLIARAHAHGITIIGGTLTPYQGASYATDAGEQIRQTVNAWIRDGGEWDAVIDFDAAVRNPADPGRMQEALQSGDWLHPSDAGYEAMAAAIDLSLFD